MSNNDTPLDGVLVSADPVLSIDVELGATIPIPESYGNIKPSVRITGIRLDGDVEAQVTAALNELPVIFRQMGEQLEVAAMDVTAPIMGDKTIAQRLAAVEGERTVYNRNFEKIQEAITDLKKMTKKAKKSKKSTEAE